MAACPLFPCRTPAIRHQRERGVVAIIVALSLAVLVGFAGIVLDLGHLFVNKTELQNAADACALAAANQLVCDPTDEECPIAFLQDAEAAGTFVAARNTNDFQDKAVTINAGDVRFHTDVGPNSAFLPVGSADTNSKFAMCTARSAPIAPWFMKVLANFAPLVVQAQAVATLAPGQTACNSSPIGVCAKSDTKPFGFTDGEWIISKFNNSQGGDESSLEGNFRWVDFSANAGGTSEIRDQLLGNGTVCNIKVGDEVKEEGVKQGSKAAWNTRFGIYPNGANAPTPASVAPDKTGYAYPSKSPGPAIAIGQSAYADYRSNQAANTPFIKQQYDGAGNVVANNQASTQDHLKYGGERRLLSVPVIECGKAPDPVKILGMACILMLNPMSNGANGDLYLEWRGMSNAPNSPCRTAGATGGTDGALVPTLVQ